MGLKSRDTKGQFDFHAIALDDDPSEGQDWNWEDYE